MSHRPIAKYIVSLLFRYLEYEDIRTVRAVGGSNMTQVFDRSAGSFHEEICFIRKTREKKNGRTSVLRFSVVP